MESLLRIAYVAPHVKAFHIVETGDCNGDPEFEKPFRFTLLKHKWRDTPASYRWLTTTLGGGEKTARNNLHHRSRKKQRFE